VADVHTETLSPAKQMARELVKGVWIAIPTPFSADGSQIDEERLAEDVEHYIADLKVEGIFCGGVMGEFWALSMAERKRVHEIVKEQSKGRIPIMAQVGHHTFSESVDLCTHAEEHGIEFGIAMNPYYPPHPPPEQVRGWYEALARETSLPMFHFNTMYAGYTLSPEQISELADIDNICGIKNPQGREHLLRVKEVAGDRIVVADAVEREWLDLHVNHGFQALMSTPALALYQRTGQTPIADYTRLADEGRMDEAREIESGLGGERDAFDRWMRDPWLERKVVPIAYLKAWLTLTGHPQGPVRPPLLPLADEELSALRDDIERLGLAV
jgi:4-hydroxy-tetrahydrodipicolinate synthase